MSRRLSVIASVVLVVTVALTAHAALTTIEPGEVKIEGRAKPALGRFVGYLPGVSASEVGPNLVFSGDLQSNLDMRLRGRHTKEAFETSKYASVKLSVEKSKLKMPADNERVDGEVDGQLTLHGVTKTVKVAYTVKRTGSDYHIKSASFSFNYTDFGVHKICRLSLCVEPLVKISIDGMKLRE